MDARYFLLAACFIGGLACTAAAQERTPPAEVKIRLASVDVGQRMEGAGTRLLTHLDAGLPAEGQKRVAAKSSRAEPVTQHIVKKHPELGGAARRPVSMEGVEAGYAQLFPAPARHRALANAAAEFSSGSDGRETEVWTLFSGPKGSKLESKPGRTAELERPRELLLALRAGF